MPCSEITASPDYYHWHELRFPKNVAKPSEDNQCHVCVSTGGANGFNTMTPLPRCIFLTGSV